jgi:hypothetical protein
MTRRIHVIATNRISHRDPKPTTKGGRYLMSIIAAGSAGVWVDEMDEKFYPNPIRANQKYVWHLPWDIQAGNVIAIEHHEDGTQTL